MCYVLGKPCAKQFLNLIDGTFVNLESGRDV